MIFNHDRDIDWRDLLLAIALIGAILLMLGLHMQAQTLPSVPAAPVAFAQPFITLPSGMTPQEPGPWRPHDPQHREPPEGWICMDPGPGVPKSHECDCAHKCEKNTPTVSCDEDGTNCVETPAAPGNHVVENSRCSVYCHPKSCGCKVEGCEST